MHANKHVVNSCYVNSNVNCYGHVFMSSMDYFNQLAKECNSLSTYLLARELLTISKVSHESDYQVFMTMN